MDVKKEINYDKFIEIVKNLANGITNKEFVNIEVKNGISGACSLFTSVLEFFKVLLLRKAFKNPKLMSIYKDEITYKILI